jgi:hypothetical protein
VEGVEETIEVDEFDPCFNMDNVAIGDLGPSQWSSGYADDITIMENTMSARYVVKFVFKDGT